MPAPYRSSSKQSLSMLNTWNGRLSLLLGLLLLLGASPPFLRMLKRLKMKHKISNYLMEQHSFSEDFAKMIVAVSAFETHFWTSRLYRKNHNLFGMKHPSIRATRSLGVKDGHAYFQNNINSIEDFVMYLRHFSYPLEYKGDLYRFVLNMAVNDYFEVDFNSYYKGVQSCYQKLYSK